MNKNRLEAFSDGVLAIIITIMVLELKIPHTDSFRDLVALFPKFLSYVLSFVYVGIYWNNHHHLIHTVHKLNGKIMWSNLNLLFWLSLLPFVTAWAGENQFSKNPVAAYGFVLMMSALAYYVLTRSILAAHGENSFIAKAVGSDFKGKISIVIYLVAIILACYMPLVSCLLYMAVALMWLIPDRRIEDKIHE